jgi:3-hydroxyacyl-[acyl-carrier-protein] dehydratase
LPHRPPFLLVDRVIALEIGKSLVALKNVSMNEPYFVGHFPNQPIMPGVIIVEALAQAASILACKSTEKEHQKAPLFLFAGIDNVRFKRMVVPGDQLRLEIELINMRKKFLKVQAVAKVNGEIACTAELMSATVEVNQ